MPLSMPLFFCPRSNEPPFYWSLWQEVSTSFSNIIWGPRLIFVACLPMFALRPLPAKYFYNNFMTTLPLTVAFVVSVPWCFPLFFFPPWFMANIFNELHAAKKMFIFFQRKLQKGGEPPTIPPQFGGGVRTAPSWHSRKTLQESVCLLHFSPHSSCASVVVPFCAMMSQNLGRLSYDQ